MAVEDHEAGAGGGRQQAREHPPIEIGGHAKTRRIGEQLIEKELQELEGMSFFTDKKLLPTFLNYYKRIASGERDLYM